MEETDSKSILTVRAAISFLKIGFMNNQGLEKERELENLLKDLESVKLQLEKNDSAYKWALIKLGHQQKTADELSDLLRKCDSKNQFYINECQELSARVNELESALKQMPLQVTESEKVQEQLSQVVSELVSAQDQLLNMEAQVAIMQEARAKAMSQAGAMESALTEEKQKSEVLKRRVLELNEIIVDLKKRVLEIEREKVSAVAKKEAELESAAKAMAEAEKQAEYTKKELESMRSLEDQLQDKMAVIGSLQVELNQATELHVSSQKDVSDAICELKKLEEDLELQEKKNLDQMDQIQLLEAELKQLRTELGDAHAKINRLNEHEEYIKSELEKEQVEIALLKFELHKGKSKLAAAEARAQGEKSAPYRTAETNSENQGGSSRNEYRDMIMEDALNGNGQEVENMKKELEIAMMKIGQLRTKAAQAVSRAEAAEKAKALMEDQVKRSKEHSVVVNEESISRDAGSSSTKHGNGAKSYHQPLAKVLDIKF